ncbi:MAG: phosphate transport system regulatory protein PhoU [Planctomycetes bacterium RIFCSPHIGHO2_12_FULL_52_36]|nr:MAG: phosphate transport system regulatory protein PhoU [Planctomycetes bacterium RIFCSPHIGHO2_02_FULL_52_58]OHB93276.1 MAG: phosphate transport system regulatory protein PhoU [Planctomycetes bacterium RIFCSPHIGHO2_12_FULL_52_36]
MERIFDKELNALKERLLYMGSMAQGMIRVAIKGLVERDESILEEVFKNEEEVNHLQIEIDDMAMRLLALRQPMAVDLRFIAASIKINSELERIADQAVNVCQNTQVLLKYPLLKPLIDIPRMAEIAQKMLNDSLEAFVNRDPDQAQVTLAEDDKLDGLKDQIFRELLTYMISDPTTVQRALCLILISRNLERIGDHATNVCEDVIYMVQGRDIRHPQKPSTPMKFH